MFNKNKNKLDSRVRFQNQGFQKQLDRQRNYKREKKTFPRSNWRVFLSKIGLGSIISRISILLTLFLLIYIVYIPNFLFIKSVQINGISQPKRTEIQNIAESFLNKKLPWPQKNLILLSQDNLKEYLLKNNQGILKVDKITKSYPATLIINIVPRKDVFALESNNAYYSLDNDGLITRIITEEMTANSALPSNLILIKLTSAESLYVGQQAISPEVANSLKIFLDSAPEIIKSSVTHYSLGSLAELNISAVTKNKFSVKFNLKDDFKNLTERLGMLFSQFSDQEISNLEYVDMRYEDRGYVCHKFQPCVNDVFLQKNQNASSSQESLKTN